MSIYLKVKFGGEKGIPVSHNGVLAGLDYFDPDCSFYRVQSEEVTDLLLQHFMESLSDEEQALIIRHASTLALGIAADRLTHGVKVMTGVLDMLDELDES